MGKETPGNNSSRVFGLTFRQFMPMHVFFFFDNFHAFLFYISYVCFIWAFTYDYFFFLQTGEGVAGKFCALEPSKQVRIILLLVLLWSLHNGIHDLLLFLWKSNFVLANSYLMRPFKYLMKPFKKKFLMRILQILLG